MIFLHGYNGNPADHQYATDYFRKELTGSLLIVPEAPEICDRNPEKLQWFGMQKYDSENLRRKPETSVRQIFAIYQKAAAEIDSRAAEINAFISEIQRKYKISDTHTYLTGFSQGAMMAVYTGLSRTAPLGGVFALSGLVCARNTLAKKINSRPPLYLFHGKQDTKVLYKTFVSTQRWLKRRNIPSQAFIYPDLTHKIIPEEIRKIAEITG